MICFIKTLIEWPVLLLGTLGPLCSVHHQRPSEAPYRDGGPRPWYCSSTMRNHLHVLPHSESTIRAFRLRYRTPSKPFESVSLAARNGSVSQHSHTVQDAISGSGESAAWSISWPFRSRFDVTYRGSDIPVLVFGAEVEPMIGVQNGPLSIPRSRRTIVSSHM